MKQSDLLIPATAPASPPAGTGPAPRSAGQYRFMEFSRVAWIYALLIGGAIVFSWPFVWMATTSIKVDREMFGEKIHMWPQRPVPQARSPYIDTRFYQDVTGKRMNEVLPALEEHLRTMSYPWPDDVDRDQAIEQAARGVFRKLVLTMPLDLWEQPLPALQAQAVQRVDSAMVKDALDQVRRHFSLGQLRARSYDLREDQLVSGENAASTWTVGGAAQTKLVPVTENGETFADVHYDFSQGDTLELSQTFKTSFPIDRLYRLQLYLRSDDSWNPLTVYVEKLGKRYEAARTYDLADYNWGIGTWQPFGPDDQSNKIRTWFLLREVGPSSVTGPNDLKVVLEVKHNSALGAWEAKALRNYRFALDNMPFWRYIATSVFLVILNLVGTLFSCSLVAYSFARLQWPGRSFCFALMLATMMVPGQVTMIPGFLIMRSLGWYNTLYPLWVGSFFSSAFNVFLLRQFLKGIPRDLEDAARIDGCGFWRVYWHIMLPLIKPTLAAIAIFTFMGTWNDFMGPLIYLSDQRLYPLSLGLYALNVSAGGMGIMMAGSLLMTVPVIVIFFFAQKYFIQGITLTGMKG
jgi:ABC-type glycerol-3-phosphate transport system permease component